MKRRTSFAALANFAIFWKRSQNAPILRHVRILKQLVSLIYPKLVLVISVPKLVANLVILILDFNSQVILAIQRTANQITPSDINL